MRACSGRKRARAVWWGRWHAASVEGASGSEAKRRGGELLPGARRVVWMRCTVCAQRTVARSTKAQTRRRRRAQKEDEERRHVTTTIAPFTDGPSRVFFGDPPGKNASPHRKQNMSSHVPHIQPPASGVATTRVRRDYARVRVRTSDAFDPRPRGRRPPRERPRGAAAAARSSLNVGQNSRTVEERRGAGEVGLSKCPFLAPVLQNSQGIKKYFFRSTILCKSGATFGHLDKRAPTPDPFPSPLPACLLLNLGVHQQFSGPKSVTPNKSQRARYHPAFHRFPHALTVPHSYPVCQTDANGDIVLAWMAPHAAASQCQTTKGHHSRWSTWLRARAPRRPPRGRCPNVHFLPLFCRTPRNQKIFFQIYDTL